MTRETAVVDLGRTADEMDMRRFDIGIIGGGGAAEALVRQLDGSGRSIVVFEDRLVGGECPFFACMPSKSLLHDARSGNTWDAAIRRRDRITEDRDDSGHAADLEGRGVTLVRARATITSPVGIDAAGDRFLVDHIVVATGARPLVPAIDGLDLVRDEIWTSEDALVTDARPDRLVIVGAGAIGVELAFAFAGFGTSVVLVNNAPRIMADAPPAVSAVIEAGLSSAGVEVVADREAVAVSGGSGGLGVMLDDGTDLVADRLLIAIGRRPATTDLGLEVLGLDPEEPLPLEANGRVRCDGQIWAIGDAAGREQYTHVGNHHARVVADHLIGSGTRTFDDVVVPACMFSTPPFFQAGQAYLDLRDDDDVVSVGADLDSFPRSTTDDLGAGHLWVAARRSTGTLVAATGAGPQFDELSHALVVAIDGEVPLARLRQSMQPFPTVGEILGPIFTDLHVRLSS